MRSGRHRTHAASFVRRSAELFATYRDASAYWKEYLDRIGPELHQLCHSRNCLRSYLAVVKQRYPPTTTSEFHLWVLSSYGDSALMGVRRMADPARGALSVVNLLRSVMRNAALLPGAPLLPERAEPLLWGVMGEGVWKARSGWRREPFRIMDVQQHLDAIAVHVAKVKQYTDRRMAHFLDAAVDQDPTFAAVNRTIDLLESTVTRYHKLLTGTGMDRCSGPVELSYDPFFRPLTVNSGPDEPPLPDEAEPMVAEHEPQRLLDDRPRIRSVRVTRDGEEVLRIICHGTFTDSTHAVSGPGVAAFEALLGKVSGNAVSCGFTSSVSSPRFFTVIVNTAHVAFPPEDGFDLEFHDEGPDEHRPTRTSPPADSSSSP